MAESSAMTMERPAQSKTATRTRKRPSSRKSVVQMHPMTRVGGSFGIDFEHDGDQITNAAATGNLFRGYENLMQGRDARDAIDLTSRVCGWCGSIHATTSAMACEMAWGLQPRPMATAIRNIATATDAIWVHAAHLAVRVGPDFCAPVIAASNPRIWDLAQRTRAPGGAIHGYQTIADIMEGMTPVTGRYWTETIPAGRRVQQMIMLLYGKWPHPSVLVPGGLASTFTIETFVNYFTRLYLSVDYVKVVISMWDDLLDFLLEVDERFEYL
ncbi:MAG: nickel-dependent hydrogenase large subunit, partial [Actinomycetota bacterium]